MTHHDTTLLQLLRLAHGNIRSGEGDTIRDGIARDSITERRWRRVSKRWESLRRADSLNLQNQSNGKMPPALVGISRTTNDRALRQAEAIAAFIDEQLPLEVARRIEAKCWTNAAWLSEIVAAYYDRHVPFTETLPVADASRIVDRLSPLVRGEVAASFPSAVRAQPIQPQSAARPQNISLRNLKSYWSAAIAASLLAIVCSLPWLMRSTPRSLVPPKDSGVQNEIAKKGNENSTKPVLPPAENSLATTENDEPHFSQIVESNADKPDPETDEDVADAEPMNYSPVDWNKVFESFAANPDPAATPPSPDPPELDSLIAEPTPLAILWHETKGVLATRGTATQAWQGIAANSNRPQRFEFATLPGSWAQGQMEPWGKITLSDNSQLRVWRTQSQNSPLYVSVSQGKAALADIPEQASIDVSAGAAQWKVTAQVPDSSIAIDLENINPRLLVIAGDVVVNGIRVAKGYEMIWGDSPSLESQKTRDRPRWNSTAPTSVRNAQRSLNRELQERLATSGDIVGELRTASQQIDAISVSDRIAAARMLISFEPGQFALETLESEDARMRNETLNWLFSQNPRVPPARPIWAAIARRTQSPDKVRTLVNWIELAAKQSRVPSEAALTMAQWLQDDQVFFRQSGQFFLNLAFGNQVDYDPRWSAELRSAAAQRWREKIAEHYRARLRRDAATQRGR